MQYTLTSLLHFIMSLKKDQEGPATRKINFTRRGILLMVVELHHVCIKREVGMLKCIAFGCHQLQVHVHVVLALFWILLKTVFH